MWGETRECSLSYFDKGIHKNTHILWILRETQKIPTFDFKRGQKKCPPPSVGFLREEHKKIYPVGFLRWGDTKRCPPVEFLREGQKKMSPPWNFYRGDTKLCPPRGIFTGGNTKRCPPRWFLTGGKTSPP